MKKKLLLPFLLLLLAFFLFNTAQSQTWSGLGTGIAQSGASVNSIVVWHGSVYAAGHFTMVGSTFVFNIAKWDGTTWTSPGSGLGAAFNTVKALCVYNDTLYAAGDFSAPSARIAKWNGTTWTGLTTGITGNIVNALVVYNNTLFVGGNFTSAGGNTCHHVAMWNGTAWSVPLDIVNNSDVNCFAIHNSELYLGGAVPSYIYKWVSISSSWTAVANSFSSTGASVYAMASYGGNLYASGFLINVGSSVAIGQWNGTTWSAVGTGFETNHFALALATFNGKLYAGGSFLDAGGTGAKYLASWNGTTWALGIAANGVGSTVNALDTVTSPLAIYAGGVFTVPYSRIMGMGNLIGIEEESLPDESVSIYPNPASDNIFISLKSELKNPRVEIYSVTGEKVYSDALTSRQKTINIRKYAAGIYFVKITSAGDGADMKALTKKIVVE